MYKIHPTIKEMGAPYKKEYQKVLSAIKRYDRIAIFRHTSPDFDALGSQFGFATWIKDNFPNKEVLCLGDHHINLNPRVFPLLDKVNASWFDKPFLAYDFIDKVLPQENRYRFSVVHRDELEKDC